MSLARSMIGGLGVGGGSCILVSSPPTLHRRDTGGSGMSAWGRGGGKEFWR